MSLGVRDRELASFKAGQGDYKVGQTSILGVAVNSHLGSLKDNKAAELVSGGHFRNQPGEHLNSLGELGDRRSQAYKGASAVHPRIEGLLNLISYGMGSA